jgi:hypothetical protein
VQAIVDLLNDDRNEHTNQLGGLIIQSWAEAMRTPEITGQAQAKWASARERLAILAELRMKLGYLPLEMSVADAAGTLSTMTSGIVVDQTHLGGAVTRGAL